jgi:F-type H+-transporting ATPase subunit delta
MSANEAGAYCAPLTLVLQAPRSFQGTAFGVSPVDAEGSNPSIFRGPRVGRLLRALAPEEEAFFEVAGEDHIVSGVAGRYATALFELGLEEKALEHIEADLNRFGEALDAVEDLARLVKSPVFSAEEQGRALAAILDELKIEGLTKNFLLLVSKNRRLFATPDMIRAFRGMLAAQRGETSATVTAASKLTEAQITALKQALKAALSKDVMLDQRVDPSLIGGLMVKVGSRMIDTSLRTKLNSLKHAMKEVG